MGWKEHYKRNTVTADEAESMVSPGDNLAIGVAAGAVAEAVGRVVAG